MSFCYLLKLKKNLKKRLMLDRIFWSLYNSWIIHHLGIRLWHTDINIAQILSVNLERMFILYSNTEPCLKELLATKDWLKGWLAVQQSTWNSLQRIQQPGRVSKVNSSCCAFCACAVFSWQILILLSYLWCFEFPKNSGPFISWYNGKKEFY